MTKQNEPEIRGIHKWPILGAWSVAVLALLLVTGSILGGVEPVGMAESPTVTERSLLFRDGRNGEVLVFGAESRRPLAIFEKGEGAFIRISMRGMARQRVIRELDVMSPYTLIKTRDGNLYISDPQSDQRIRVSAFGPIATNSFKQFLERDYSEKGAEG